jgi:ABC-type glutathione transport system ATPase component
MSASLRLSWSPFAVVRRPREIVVRYEAGAVAFYGSLAVAGRSGSGKSIFARSLAGALPVGLSCQGSLLLERQLPTGEALAIMPREMTYIPQSPASALPSGITCGALLREVIGWNDASAPGSLQATDYLERVGLNPETTGRLQASQLSGGMAQRFAIALAIARSPRALVLDEPTVGLDAAAVRVVLAVLESLIREDGIAAIIVTHDERVGTFVDRWIELRRNGFTASFIPRASTRDD